MRDFLINGGGLEEGEGSAGLAISLPPKGTYGRKEEVRGGERGSSGDILEGGGMGPLRGGRGSITPRKPHVTENTSY